jgi:hypothetical protein
MDKVKIWKPIKSYEGLYEISNDGDVRSLTKNRSPYTGKNGYCYISLCKNGKQKTHYLHQLVWDAFGDQPRNGFKLQIDHIDENKMDNSINNLRLVTHRQNNSRHKNKTSQYVGVSWHKLNQKWLAQMKIDGKIRHLGYFSTEYLAHLAYQNKLEQIGEVNG